MAMGGVEQKQLSLNEILFSPDQFRVALNSMEVGSWLVRQSSVENCLAVSKLLPNRKIGDRRYALIKEGAQYFWRLVNTQNEIEELSAEAKIQRISEITNIQEFMNVLLDYLNKNGYEQKKQMIKCLPKQELMSDHDVYLTAYKSMLAQQKIKMDNFALEMIAQDEQVRTHGFGGPSSS
jgi:hypothetical protein